MVGTTGTALHETYQLGLPWNRQTASKTPAQLLRESRVASHRALAAKRAADMNAAVAVDKVNAQHMAKLKQELAATISRADAAVRAAEAKRSAASPLNKAQAQRDLAFAVTAAKVARSNGDRRWQEAMAQIASPPTATRPVTKNGAAISVSSANEAQAVAAETMHFQTPANAGPSVQVARPPVTASPLVKVAAQGRSFRW